MSSESIQITGGQKKVECGWIVTDPDCFQCCRTINASDRVYEFVQVNDYTKIGHGYRLAHGTIYMDDYSDEDISDCIHAYGYDSLQDISPDSTDVEWRLVAEMIFEEEATEFEASYPTPMYDSLSEIGAQISSITDLTLEEYYRDNTNGEEAGTDE